MSSKQNRVRKLLEQGLQSHRVGDLAAAEQAYVKAAEADPRNADALNLRGAVALTTGRTPLAVTLFRKAAALQSGNPGLWSNLGNALLEAGEYTASQAAYQRAAQLAPENPDFAIGIANALAGAGDADEAQQRFASIVARHPARAPAWFGLAKLAQSAGHADQALDYYQRALQADPNYGVAHLNLGAVLQSLQRMDEAEQRYRHALACGGPREATYINLVSILITQGKSALVEPIALAAISEFPRCADIYRLLSGFYTQQGRLTAALAPAHQAAALDPHNLKVQLALGGLLFETGHPEQGLAALEALRLAHPDDLQVAYLVGVTQLTAGNFQAGWQYFSQREVRQTKIQSLPWLSECLPPDLKGKTIQLLREQGLGDELFFLRFVPLLKRLGAEVRYVTNAKLLSMLERVDCLDQVMAQSTARDAAVPPDASGIGIDMLVGDLPHALLPVTGADASALPPPLTLSALPERLSSMREKLLRLGPPPYLAVTWRGGTAPDAQKGDSWTLFKNITLEAFGKTLAGLPFTVLAIQRNPLPQEIHQLTAAAGAPIHDLCDVNDDLEDMLALLAVIDEYVGVSNTNMHLRAGLNRSAHVLVPRPSEWRWMAYGEQSPWFPGFEVYRQAQDGTWTGALERLRGLLLKGSSTAGAQ